MIVLTTTANSIDDAVGQVIDQLAWIDGVELRVDLLDEAERPSLDRFPRLLRERGAGPLPLICTVRRQLDGGASADDEPARLDLLARAVEAGYGFVDLEADLGDSDRHMAIVRAAGTAADGAHRCRIVRSLHDFTGVPADLASLVRSLPRGPAEIPKAAVMPTSTADLLAVVRAARSLGATEHIVLGMGEFGVITRILPKRLGNLLTFASVPGGVAAPGHLDPRTLAELYRVLVHDGATRLFAVIGNPIAHSKSPEYHNGRFIDEGIDAVYVPILVDDVTEFFALAHELDILGVSVTIPHKQAVIRELADVGDDVRAANACNTLVRVPEGWRGINTDVIGFLAPLDEVLPVALAGTRVLVLGAGGAARGVVYALLSRGADVVVWNRTATRARELVREMTAYDARGNVRALSQDAMDVFDVVVNTTSVGMHGEGDPAEWYEFAGHEVVYDIVYTPPETPMVRRAATAGCRVVTGDRMFRAQAAAQYELYRTLATAGLVDA